MILLFYPNFALGEINGFDIVNLVEFGSAIFSLLLAFLSFLAWSRRRQTALLIVSIAFVLFFLRTIVELTPQMTNSLEIILAITDFAILSLFFVAVVVRPRRKGKNEQQVK